MAELKELRCVIGDCSYTLDEVAYTCPRHGELGTWTSCTITLRCAPAWIARR